jgi:hypothetical protein
MRIVIGGNNFHTTNTHARIYRTAWVTIGAGRARGVCFSDCRVCVFVRECKCASDGAQTKGQGVACQTSKDKATLKLTHSHAAPP